MKHCFKKLIFLIFIAGYNQIIKPASAYGFQTDTETQSTPEQNLHNEIRKKQEELVDLQNKLTVLNLPETDERFQALENTAIDSQLRDTTAFNMRAKGDNRKLTEITIDDIKNTLTQQTIEKLTAAAKKRIRGEDHKKLIRKKIAALQKEILELQAQLREIMEKPETVPFKVPQEAIDSVLEGLRLQLLQELFAFKAKKRADGNGTIVEEYDQIEENYHQRRKELGEDPDPEALRVVREEHEHQIHTDPQLMAYSNSIFDFLRPKNSFIKEFLYRTPTLPNASPKKRIDQKLPPGFEFLELCFHPTNCCCGHKTK